MHVSLEDVFSLSGREWGPVPRIARTIPFGYMVYDDDPNVLQPVLVELEALEKAKKYRKEGYSLRVVAAWLSEATGRDIGHNGLDRRINLDSSRRRKSATLKKWASAYKEALIKAYRYDKRNGGDLSEYPAEFIEFLERNA